MEKKHHISKAKDKYKKGEDITICLIENDGVIYKGKFYSDCMLEPWNEKAAICIEVDDFLHLFTPNGSFASAIRLDTGLKHNKKLYVGFLDD